MKERPYNKTTGRDYRRDYRKFQSSRTQKRRRAKRNAARRLMLRKGKARKGDKLDIHHKRGFSNKASNLALISRSRNRAMR